ncbi:MAG: DUF302 domain-containing protein [Gammaproteobacteria bacterium]|nr:DUF302 domain-containing protein [Gammaproteobacteria bacterium]
MKIINKIVLLTLFLCSSVTNAETANVFQHSIHQPMSQVYDRLYKALEDEGFYVVFEANIGKNLSRFAEKWGDNYNRNQLDGIRSMVFCNGWYANAVSNADPAMLALCPLRLTLTEKNSITTVLFARPTVIAADSPAKKILTRVENEIIEIITSLKIEQ